MTFRCPYYVNLAWFTTVVLLLSVPRIQVAVALSSTATTAPVVSSMPPISPATQLPNQLFQWKNQQQIRYQQSGPLGGDPVLLIHGLFVNSDHWRKTITALAEEGYNVYALDLWGYGYSSKPPYDSDEARAVNGETGRFTMRGENYGDQGIYENVSLGTANGQGTRVRDIELLHPIGSPYNFFTWSELITDFSRDVIGVGKVESIWRKKTKPVSLVCNSIGTSSSFQALLDKPDYFTGVCVITPNFRELHSAEIPFPSVTMPLVRGIQKLLREKGQPLFDTLATPNTVKEILKEPYEVTSAIDDTLVDVLLDPLLLPGASNVVFDTLSYSAGPLPEQQLEMLSAANPGGTTGREKPVWISYGTKDPWTPPRRVDALQSKGCVEKVVAFPNIGHCPHDEAPELVNPFIVEFLQRVSS